MLVISSKEFKNNQAMYLDLVDKNEQVILRRGKRKSYFIRPLTEEDKMSINPELIARIRQSEQEIKEGKGTKCRTIEESMKFLDNL